MERPREFEEFRFVGDKRTQIVYDVDHLDEERHGEVIAELMASGRYLCFAPDTLVEARNRGYRLSRLCDAAAASA